jgi:rod shape-determining protein MreC
MNFSAGAFVNKKKKILPKVLIGAVILSLFIFVLNIFGSQAKNSFFILSYPIQKVFFAAGSSASGYLGSFLNGQSLIEENENLKSENQKLLSQIFLLRSIQYGNDALSEISETCQNQDFKTVMAGVIGLDGQDMLSINKGSDDGISEGMPVIGQQNVLYGKIFKVYKNFSKIMLISAKDSVINVRVQQDDLSKPQVEGVVKGSGGLSIFLDLIPVDEQINEGDILTTSALEGTFPKDILVGKIMKKEKNDQKPFQQAQVQPFFNLDGTDNLFVITDYKR